MRFMPMLMKVGTGHAAPAGINLHIHITHISSVLPFKKYVVIFEKKKKA